MNDTQQPQRGFFSRLFRALILMVFAVGAGFAAGYYVSDTRARLVTTEATQRAEAAELRATNAEAQTAARIAELEKQVLEAEKTGLERALARAKLMVGVDELLESLTAASAEVEQRNFGRALRRVERARQLLDGPNVPPQIRDSIGPQLVEIRGRLEQLDPVVGERLASLARDLEQGLATTPPPPPTQ